MDKVKAFVVYFAVVIVAFISLIISRRFDFKFAYDIVVVAFGILIGMWVCAVIHRDL